jgi:hypothetical protein
MSFVRIHDLARCSEDAARLSVVSEVCSAQDSIMDGFAPFLPDAVGPRGPWRAPTSQERRSLIGEPGVYEESDLLIVPLPGLAQALAAHLGAREDFAVLHKAVRDVAFVRALDGCIDELIPYCLRPEGLTCQGAWVNPGGMRLVTHNMNMDPPRRIGLHVDNWDDLPLDARERGRRRLCVNLGLRPRYLLFLRTPLSALVKAGGFPSTVPENMSPAMLVRAHLRRHAGQLVARVRIDPGEAYIVNADDVIHDGASDMIGVPDVALHFLGFFGPPEGV